MILMLPAHGSQPLLAQQPAPAGGRTHAVDRRAHRRHAEDRRLLPALLGRAHRIDVPRDPAVRHRVPVLDRPVGRPRLERHRPRSRPGRRRPRRRSSSASARACCWCSPTSRSARAARTRSSASRSRTRSRSRSCGASPSPPNRRPRARRRHRFLPARRHTAPASALRPGNYRVDRTRSAFYLPQHARNFPKNTEVDMTLTFVNEAAGGGRRRRRRPGAGSGADRRRPAVAAVAAVAAAACSRASVGSVTPTPDAVTLREHASFVELPDGNYKPRVDDPRAGYGGLSFVDYSAPIGEPIAVPLHPPPSPREEGSDRGDQRAGQADSVLGRLGRARGREEGARRRRELVEPGVRGRRLPQRVQGRRAARRRRPDGHPLQHDQLGPPLDARLELGRHRSPIRAPARSSRPRSRSARCAIARTT